MWIASNSQWHKSHTDLSKYFIEKIKQRLDCTEVISNRHKTSNGFTLIAELLNVGIMTLNRKKSNNRLISLVKESQSYKIKSSIVNDYILNAYFKDIVKEIKAHDTTIILKDENSIKNFLHRLKIHKSRLEKTT